MVIELLAGKMRLDRGRIAAVGCSSMGAGSIGGKNYCGNLLWQSSLTLLVPGADSLDTVELIMAFEEAFGGAIPEEESRDLTTVGAVIDYLKAKGYGEKKPG